MVEKGLLDAVAAGAVGVHDKLNEILFDGATETFALVGLAALAWWLFVPRR
jgi:hypothetical protein